MLMSAGALLVTGAILLGAGWWVRPIAEAEDAVQEGRVDGALELYGVAERRFDTIPVSKRVLPGLYDAVVANELSLLYSLGRYEEIIQKAGAAGVPGGSFWAGSALFAKALQESKPGARMGWLLQSQEEFRRALEFSPGDWDAKFNFEAIGRLIAELQKQPEEGILQLLKPQLPRTAPRRG